MSERTTSQLDFLDSLGNAADAIRRERAQHRGLEQQPEPAFKQRYGERAFRALTWIKGIGKRTLVDLILLPDHPADEHYRAAIPSRHHTALDRLGAFGLLRAGDSAPPDVLADENIAVENGDIPVYPRKATGIVGPI